MEVDRKEFRELVAYLLDCERTTDNETIDSYTDSVMLGIELQTQQQSEATNILKIFTHYVIDKIRNSHTDAEVRRYLSEILK